jgi:hypothetical protein
VSETATRRVERTRREAIKRGLALVGLAGAATTGKFVIDGPPAGASEQPDQPSEPSGQPSGQPAGQPAGGTETDGSPGRSFSGLNLDVSGPGFPPGVLPDGGDRLVITGDLLDASGAVIGNVFGTYLQLVPFGQAGPGDPTSLQDHAFSFADGSVHGRGLAGADLDAGNVFAIIGGTGRYLGISGSYVAVERFLTFGGDGSATFDLTTNPEASPNGGS